MGSPVKREIGEEVRRQVAESRVEICEWSWRVEVGGTVGGKGNRKGSVLWNKEQGWEENKKSHSKGEGSGKGYEG